MKASVLGLIVTMILGSASGSWAAAAGKGKAMLNFDGTAPGDWYSINDDVMGGISRGGIERTGAGTGMFAGVLSLANNGGFASVRAVMDRRDLSDVDGLAVRVRGDGRTYQLRLRSNGRYDGVAYRAEFGTRAGEWVTVSLPFRDFEPTFRGRRVLQAPPLDTANIRQLSFMLADGRAGAFALEIDEVSPWVRLDKTASLEHSDD